ncbi:MAG: glycosyltransferase family 4 protein [Pseudomonadota bacterium]
MSEPYRPKILLLTRNLPPLVGGMERLNWHMAEQLAKVAELRVVGPAGAAAVAPAGLPIREARIKPLSRFLCRAGILGCREARAWKPDLVLAGSGLTAPLALAAARLCGARAMAYVHGLDVAVRNPIYRALWLPALRRMDRVIANSRATATLCHDIGIPPERLGIVHPGVALPTALPDDRTVARFRAEHGLGDRPLLLSVGRLSTRKGLREFVAHALPRIVKACPDVMLLIVGDTPAQALHAQAQTPESIRTAAEQAAVGDHLRFLGLITDLELGVAYRAANVHVFPVREIAGDPEGFGMVAVEAAAHGLPTVAFATGGVVDAVADGVSGLLVPAGDYGAFADASLRALAWGHQSRDGCLEFARRFSWDMFGVSLVTELGHGIPHWRPQESVQ